MVGILILAHGTLGQSMIDFTRHVFGDCPPQLDCLTVGPDQDPEDLLRRARDLARDLDTGDGVLVLSDLYGATPCNVACRVLVPGRVEGVAGANLPMLLRALGHRQQPLSAVVQMALSGGTDGVRPLPMNASSDATT